MKLILLTIDHYLWIWNIGHVPAECISWALDYKDEYEHRQLCSPWPHPVRVTPRHQHHGSFRLWNDTTEKQSIDAVDIKSEWRKIKKESNADKQNLFFSIFTSTINASWITQSEMNSTLIKLLQVMFMKICKNPTRYLVSAARHEYAD
jgi:hypothetical protein